MTGNPQRPKPWHIVHSEASTGWGGQEHRVLAELTGFKARGQRVSLLAPAKAVIYQRAQEAGIEVVPLRDKKAAFPLEVIRITRWLRRNRADIVNPHSSRDGWLVGVAGRLARVPLLIRSRHIDVEYPNAWLSRHAFTTLADHVLTTSNRITEHFQTTFGIPADRISTIPTGIDIRRFSPDGAKAGLLASFLEAPGPVIGMISVLRSWKGHAVFFAAAKRLLDSGQPCRFMVVGGGAPIEGMEKMAAKQGVAGRIYFTGHREDVPELLRRLDVLVIPSIKHEGVPQIGLQALACRTPVVGSDAGGIPEIIRPGETGRIFPAGNDEALAKAIRTTLMNREETQALTERGRRDVEARHSLDAMLDRLEVIYQRYLSR